MKFFSAYELSNIFSKLPIRRWLLRVFSTPKPRLTPQPISQAIFVKLKTKQSQALDCDLSTSSNSLQVHVDAVNGRRSHKALRGALYWHSIHKRPMIPIMTFFLPPFVFPQKNMRVRQSTTSAFSI